MGMPGKNSTCQLLVLKFSWLCSSIIKHNFAFDTICKGEMAREMERLRQISVRTRWLAMNLKSRKLKLSVYGWNGRYDSAAVLRLMAIVMTAMTMRTAMMIVVMRR